MKQQQLAIASHQFDWYLKGIVVELTLLRLQLVLKLFNPLQPRVPAGNRDGGQWVDDNGRDTSNKPLIQPAAGRESDRLSGRDLAQDPYLNRHIMDEHVGKTDQELIARVSEMQGGVFLNCSQALRIKSELAPLRRSSPLKDISRRRWRGTRSNSIASLKASNSRHF